MLNVLNIDNMDTRGCQMFARLTRITLGIRKPLLLSTTSSNKGRYFCRQLSLAKTTLPADNSDSKSRYCCRQLQSFRTT